MRTLTIALVHDGGSEHDSYAFFNETLSPLLEHVDCDVHIVEEAETDEHWARERTGDDELDPESIARAEYNAHPECRE